MGTKLLYMYLSSLSALTMELRILEAVLHTDTLVTTF